MQVQTGLMAFHIVGSEIPLASHRPYRWYDLGVFRDSVSRYQFPVLVFDVAVDFLNYSSHKFLRIWLSQRLIEIHDVTHHFSVEIDRIPHAFLKIKVCIVEQVIRSFSDFGFVSHIVHVPRTIEILQRHRVSHKFRHGTYASTLACTGCDRSTQSISLRLRKFCILRFSTCVAVSIPIDIRYVIFFRCCDRCILRRNIRIRR